jgi:hypothetical protein
VGKPVAGEVVVLPFPQTDLRAGKRRPDLVVADLAGDDQAGVDADVQRDRLADPRVPAADFERGRL